jgi:hypothetical protein
VLFRSATWEDTIVMKSQYPQLNLEDKVMFPGGVLLGLTHNPVQLSNH